VLHIHNVHARQLVRLLQVQAILVVYLCILVSPGRSTQELQVQAILVVYLGSVSPGDEHQITNPWRRVVQIPVV